MPADYGINEAAWGLWAAVSFKRLLPKYHIEQETQLSLTNCAMHLCKCNDVDDLHCSELRSVGILRIRLFNFKVTQGVTGHWSEGALVRNLTLTNPNPNPNPTTI